MSIHLSSPTSHTNRNAIAVVMKATKYSVVALVNLHWTINALHYHIQQGTTNMSIPSLYVIDLKMTLVNIIVIFVKKNETQNIGSTTVKIVVILLIPNVFLGNTQIGSTTYNGKLFGGTYTFVCCPHPFSFIEKLKTTLICNSSCEI